MQTLTLCLVPLMCYHGNQKSSVLYAGNKAQANCGYLHILSYLIHFILPTPLNAYEVFN